MRTNLVEGAAEAAFDVVDHLRARLLSAALGVPSLQAIVTRRHRRLAVQSLLSVVVLAAATLLAPGILLVLGPIVLGVAHVTGDVRHLVSRRDVPRAWAVLVAIACTTLLGLRIAELAGPTWLPYARFEVLAGWGWVAAGVVLGACCGPSFSRALLMALPLALLAAASAVSPTVARAILGYAHNLVALVVWLVLFRQQRTAVLASIVTALAIAVLLASGSLVPWTHWDGLWAGRVIDEWLGLAGRHITQQTAIGIGLSYVFLQAVHYAVWVSWIPQDDTCGHGTLTFRMTARALYRDLGRSGVALAVIAATVMVVASFARVHPTRAVYMSLAAFHGWLELAALAFFVARGSVGRASGNGSSGIGRASTSVRI
jgi:hypothetical protein